MWEASLRRQVPVITEYGQVVTEVERALAGFLAQPDDFQSEIILQPSCGRATTTESPKRAKAADAFVFFREISRLS